MGGGDISNPVLTPPQWHAVITEHGASMQNQSRMSKASPPLDVLITSYLLKASVMKMSWQILKDQSLWVLLSVMSKFTFVIFVV